MICAVLSNPQVFVDIAQTQVRRYLSIALVVITEIFVFVVHCMKKVFFTVVKTGLNVFLEELSAFMGIE